MDLTVELTCLYMLLWNEKFYKMFVILGLKMDFFRRYVDDSVQITGALEQGYEYYPNSKINHKAVSKYDHIPG